MVKAMKRNNQTPTETPEQICARAVAAGADIAADLRGLLGAGASRALLGQVAEAAKQIEAQMSSLKYDPAGTSPTDHGRAKGDGDDD